MLRNAGVFAMSTPGIRDMDMDEGVQAYAQHLESSAGLAPSGRPAHAEALVFQPSVTSAPARTRRTALTQSSMS